MLKRVIGHLIDTVLGALPRKSSQYSCQLEQTSARHFQLSMKHTLSWQETPDTRGILGVRA